MSGNNPNSKKRKAGGGSTGDEGEAELDPKAKRRAQIAKAARKHRQRQKDELAYLRQQVSTIEEEITVLRKSEPAEQVSETGWRQEAMQQAELRAKVDRENEFLRHTLVDQLKFTRRLQQFLTRQPVFGGGTSVNTLLSNGMGASGGATVTEMPLLLDSMPPTSTSKGATIQLLEDDVSSGLLPTQTPTAETFSPATTADKDQELFQLAQQTIEACPSAIAKANEMFAGATDRLMYMGVEVQYQMGGNEMRIYLRQSVFDVPHGKLAGVAWETMNDKQFNEDFPFVEDYQIIRQLDNNTSYQKHIYATGNQGLLRSEALLVLRRRICPEHTYFGISTVDNDPEYPRIDGLVREKVMHNLVVRQLNASADSGSELIWCINKSIRERDIPGNDAVTNSAILLRSIFENTPRWFQATINRARQS